VDEGEKGGEGEKRTWGENWKFKKLLTNRVRRPHPNPLPKGEGTLTNDAPLVIVVLAALEARRENGPIGDSPAT
jgi:hypothetical protein